MSALCDQALRHLPPVFAAAISPAASQLDLDWGAVLERLDGEGDGPAADRFFSALSATSRGAAVGLDLAGLMEPSAPHAVIYLLMSAPTLGEAFRLLARFVELMRLTPRPRIEIGLGANRAVVAFGDGRHPLALSAFAARCLLRLAGFLTGTELSPLEVRFRQVAPSERERFDTALGAPVVFGHSGGDQLVLRACDLERPSIHANDQLRELLTRQVERELAGAERDRIVAQVSLDLEGNLGRRTCDLATVAFRLGTSERTLQRRLAAAGTSFTDVLEDVRRLRVLAWIRDTTYPLETVARRAGFSDYSSLYRAVVRWTGQSPRALRDAASNGSGA